MGINRMIAPRAFVTHFPFPYNMPHALVIPIRYVVCNCCRRLLEYDLCICASKKSLDLNHKLNMKNIFPCRIIGVFCPCYFSGAKWCSRAMRQKKTKRNKKHHNMCDNAMKWYEKLITLWKVYACLGHTKILK